MHHGVVTLHWHSSHRVDQFHKQESVMFLKRLGTSLTGIKDSVSVQIELLKAVVVSSYFIIITAITIVIKILIIILVHYSYYSMIMILCF